MAAWSAGFTGDLTSWGLNGDGQLTLTFTVDRADKYDVLPITDIKGKAFTVRVMTKSQQVFAGKEGLEEARERVRAKLGLDGAADAGDDGA